MTVESRMSDLVNPEWETFENRYQTLLAEDLTPERVPAWLTRWSDLDKEVGETAAVLTRQGRGHARRGSADSLTALYPNHPSQSSRTGASPQDEAA